MAIGETSVVEIGVVPVTCVVTARTLSREMAGRARVARLAIGEAGMVEAGIAPVVRVVTARTLPGIMTRWSRMTG